MSENYGDCRSCKGKGKRLDSTGLYSIDCAYCGGTGMSGNAEDLRQRERVRDNEIERKRDWVWEDL